VRELAALVALSVFLSVAYAHADEPAAKAPRALRPVTVTIAGDPDPRATETTLRDLFSHLDVAAPPLTFSTVHEIEPRSITDPPAQIPPAFARVWIDVRSDTAVISIADKSWERIYLRRTPRPAGADEVTREQIAHIVVSAIETMLAGGRIGVARAEIAAPQAAPAPPPEPRPPDVAPSAPAIPMKPKSRRVANLALGYEALAFSSDTQAHGPWGSLRGALMDGAWAVGLSLSAQWRAPILAEAAPIGVRLDTTAVRLVLDFERALGSRVALRAGVGPGFDFLSIEPRGVSRSAADGQPAISVENRRSRIAPVIRWSVGAEVRLAPSVRLGIAAVLDHDPVNRAYFVRDGTEARDVLAPFPLRPGLTLALIGDLFRR
jgi:hypothetical protein